jgi:hypothetical protein
MDPCECVHRPKSNIYVTAKTLLANFTFDFTFIYKKLYILFFILHFIMMYLYNVFYILVTFVC